MGSITVWLTSCLFCLDSATFLMLIEQKIFLLVQIETSQTGDQLNTDTSPYGEWSLLKLPILITVVPNTQKIRAPS